jgi:signal transduction histidine kinase
MRNMLTTAMLTFEALEKGNVGILGSTGKLLGRTLQRMRILTERTLAEVRLEAGTQKSERISIADLLREIATVGALEAKHYEVELSVDAGSSGVTVHGDQQILASVMANLVQNALKFTRPGHQVGIRTHTTDKRVLIEVEDGCGGLPPGKAQDLFRPFQQGGEDRSGMGLGLSISLRGVRASGGDIQVRDLPGSGCVFTVDLPKAAPDA